MSNRPKDLLISEITDAVAHTESLAGVNEVMGLSRFRCGAAPCRELFSSARLGCLTLSNRCLIAPLRHIGGSFLPDDKTRRFYLDRADAGLLTTGPVRLLSGNDPLAVLRWTALNEAIHARGARMLLQIEVSGAEAQKAAYFAAAAPAACFDGVCLLAREDDRDLQDHIRAIRSRLGDRYPILCRLSLSPAAAESDVIVPKSRSFRGLSARFEQMTALAKAGVDGIEVCLGSQDTPWLMETASQLPAACFSEAARALKAHFNILGLPVVVAASGRIDSPELAERILKKDYCDLISLDGAGISDPGWCRKAALGRAEEICPLPLPELSVPAGHERIAVIGAGCRGLSYAIRAAGAGHEIELYEEKRQPGGTLALFTSGAAQAQENMLAFLLAELGKRPQIRLHAGTRADRELLKKGGFDRIVFACSAERITAPSVPGWGEIPFVGVELPEEALSGKWKRKPVAVLGGDALSCDIAWKLQSEGLARKVTLITEQAQILPGAREAERSWFSHHLPLRGGAVYSGYRLREIRKHLIILEDEKGKPVNIRSERIVLAQKKPAPLRLYQESVKERLAPVIQLL